MAIQKLVQEDPTLPGQHRSRNRADDSGRHGRAASRNHRRPHEARVRRRRERRQAAGGVSRDHPQHGRRRLHAQEADRRQRPVRARQAARRAESRARASSSRTKSRGGIDSEGIHSGRREGRRGSAGRRHSGRLSDVGRQGDAVRRRLSRCRFVGNGVQDLRFDLRQGSRAQGQAGAARAGDARRSGGAGRVHGSGERRPDLAARPAGRHGDAGHDADHQGDGAACRRCSAMRPSCVRARRVAAVSRCTSGSTKKCRRASRKRSSAGCRER